MHPKKTRTPAPVGKKSQKNQHQSQGEWLAFAANRTEKIDAFITLRAAALLREIPGICFVAVGGYGRGELAPASDIDLLVFADSRISAPHSRKLNDIASWPWVDGLRCSLLVHDAETLQLLIAKDIGTLTSLLDRRLVAGDATAMKSLDKLVNGHIKDYGVPPLIAAKLAEQDARHLAMGDSRYHLQPDVKEGKGALRDIQTLRWLAQLMLGSRSDDALVKADILSHDEAARLTHAHDFFSTVRYHLHLHAGRAQDRLAFELQPVIAEKMGYTGDDATTRAEDFMRDYFRMTQETGYLTRILCTALEDRALATAGATAGRRQTFTREEFDGFEAHNNRLLLATDTNIKKEPAIILRLYRASQKSGMDIHPDSLRTISAVLPDVATALSTDRTAYGILFDILCDDRHCAQTLRRMNEAGVLLAMIPAFANIHVHMQFDMYHTYTADEHTIRACGILHDIAQGRLATTAPLATGVFPTLAMPRLLYLAMFLHDMAKGSGEDHARAGAQLAREYAPLFGLDAAETDMLAWLIEHHLLMTMTAFKRDLEDEETIAHFVAQVQSPERLKMLLPLTVADIMAVGPDIWNGWKAGLLRLLYQRAYDRMTDAPATPAPDQTAVYEAALKKVTAQDGTRIALQQHASGTARLIVSTPDRKALFATLAGAIAAAGGSIVEARILTRSNGDALDVFEIQDSTGNPYSNEKYLIKTIHRALSGKLDIAQEIAERRKQLPRSKRHAHLPARVIIDNTASRLHTLVEINATDRPGLLYDVTATLAAEGMNIHAAKVATFGRHAVDVFYIKDVTGLKIEHAGRLASLEKALKMGLENRD